MTIFYCYNEILPRHKAHDLFVFHECSAFARMGKKVHLLCGKGSAIDGALYEHYKIPLKDLIYIERLPILRKNNPFNLSWNLPFYVACQQRIKKTRPQVVIFSVRKQAAYHFKRKIPGTRYIYEAHELLHYPTAPADCEEEREMLKQADLITVTTYPLKQILRNAPYSLTNPIEVIPLAVAQNPLPAPPEEDSPLVILYCGQLYEGQGTLLLLKALQETKNVSLHIVGGKPEEVNHFKKVARSFGVANKVLFFGFRPPAELPALAARAHAFVAPFENKGRMPYVAHTKLYEYARWGRPLIAPKLPIVEEYFTNQQNALFFEPDSPTSLAHAINQLHNRSLRAQLQQAMQAYVKRFTWEERIHRYLDLFC